METPPDGLFATDVASRCRVIDYLSGGKDNYEADRALAYSLRQIYPQIDHMMRACRQFQVLATAQAWEAGCRQFLDIGAGLHPVVHEPFRHRDKSVPDPSLVYVEWDPLTLVHGRACYTGMAQYGAPPYPGFPDTVYWVPANPLDPESVYSQAAKYLDFDEPIALSLVNTAEFLLNARELVAYLRERLAPKSVLIMTHAARIDERDDIIDQVADEFCRNGIPYHVCGGNGLRDHFFDGMSLWEPGLVPPQCWRADEGRWSVADGSPVHALAAAGRSSKCPQAPCGARTSCSI